MEAYALAAGEGWTYAYGIPHTIKLGEARHRRGAAVLEYTTRKGEEPGMHTHSTEDELFYVLSGEITFHCNGQDYPLSSGGFMFLPVGVPHGYTIPGEEEVKLLVITIPIRSSEAGGWEGYTADVETSGDPISEPI